MTSAIEISFESGGAAAEDIMNTRISVVLDIINRVEVLDGRFQINQHQCKRLADFYTAAGQFFNSLKEYFNRDADSQRLYSLPSLDVIISVLLKGQLLLQKYTEKDWLVSVVTAGVNRNSFVAIHVELETFIRSIHEVLNQGRASGMLLELKEVIPLLSVDKDNRVTLFEEDAEKDREHMLVKIVSGKFDVRSRDILCCLGMKQTIQRSYDIRSLDLASKKISATNFPNRATGTQELPSYLLIKSEEIKKHGSLGRGGSAEVVKCRWLQHDYALKILNLGDNVEPHIH